MLYMRCSFNAQAAMDGRAHERHDAEGVLELLAGDAARMGVAEGLRACVRARIRAGEAGAAGPPHIMSVNCSVPSLSSNQRRMPGALTSKTHLSVSWSAMDLGEAVRASWAALGMHTSQSRRRRAGGERVPWGEEEKRR